MTLFSTTPKPRPAAVTILLDGARGIYIPRDFVTGFDLSFDTSDVNGTGWQGINDADIDACRDPDGEGYWDAWQSILDSAFYTDEFGDVYRLYQDGDLFAYCPERMTDEEKRNLGFDQ